MRFGARVMFLHLSVCSQGGGGLPTEGGSAYRGRRSSYRGRGSAYKRGGGLLMGGAVCLQGEGSAAYSRGLAEPPLPRNQKSGRYAFFWNAFLLLLYLGILDARQCFLISKKAVVSSPILQTVSSEHQRILINRFMIITTLTSFQIVTSKFPFSLTLSVNSYCWLVRVS